MIGLLRQMRHFESISAWRTLAIVMLAIGYAVAQGAGIGLLLPLVQILEGSTDTGVGGILLRMVNSGISATGLPPTLIWLSVAVFGSVVLAQVLNYGHQYLSLRASHYFAADLRRTAFSRFVGADMPFHYENRTGTLAASLVEDAGRAGSALLAMHEIAIRVIVTALYIVLLMLMSWQIALVGSGALLLVTLITHWWLQRSRRLGESVSEWQEVMQTLATERLQGVRDVKIAAREDVERERFGEAAVSLASARAGLGLGPAQIRGVVEPALVGAGLVVLYIGSTFANLGLAELAVFAYALIRITPEARQLNASRYVVAGHAVALRRILRLIDLAGNHTERSKADGRELGRVENEIKWEGVSFDYGPDRPVLQSFDLTIRAGQTTAVVGPSGAGKSTIMALLVRLAEPSGGRILIDGTPIDEFALAGLRRRIALVPQDAAIFHETVAENIRFAKPKATRDEVIAAAKMANAEEFILQLPQQYDTMVGERGTFLSSGQRQRIALARALLLDPAVLLLDEVTSAQDPASERSLQDAVWRASESRTVLIVTHRLSSIRGVHRVVVLQDGQFVEDGTPEDLLKANGLFRQYYELQIGEGWERSPLNGA